VETPVLHRLREMARADPVLARQVGDRPRDADDARVRARREAEPLARDLEELAAAGVERAVPAQLARRQLRVEPRAADALPRAGRLDARADRGRPLADVVVAEEADRDAGHLDVEVDAVEEGARHAAPVAGDLRRRARAAARRIA